MVFRQTLKKENGYGYFIPDSSRAGEGNPGRQDYGGGSDAGRFG